MLKLTANERANDSRSGFLARSYRVRSRIGVAGAPKREGGLARLEQEVQSHRGDAGQVGRF